LQDLKLKKVKGGLSWPPILCEEYSDMLCGHLCLRSRLYAGGQCTSVQPGLLKPNRITEVEVTHIDAAKQVEPDISLGFALKMKDAFRLAHLH